MDTQNYNTPAQQEDTSSQQVQVPMSGGYGVANPNINVDQARQNILKMVDATNARAQSAVSNFFSPSVNANMPVAPSGISSAEKSLYGKGSGIMNAASQDTMNYLAQFKSELGNFNAASDQVGQSAADYDNAMQAREQTLADQNAAVAAQYGVSADPSAPIAQIATQTLELIDKSRAAKQAISDVQGTSILDNPLTWLTSSITVPKLQQAADNYDAQLATNYTAMTQLQNDATNAQNITARNIPSITTEMAAAQASKDLASAQLNKTQADMAAILNSASLRNQSASQALQAVNLGIDMNDKDRQQHNIAVDQMRQNVQASNNLAQARAAMAESLSNMANKQAAIKMQQLTTVKGLQLLGYNPTTPEQAQAMFARLPKQFQEMVQIGGMNGTLGTNPGETVIGLGVTRPGTQIAPQTAQTISLLQEYARTDPNLKALISQSYKDPVSALNNNSAQLTNMINNRTVQMFSAPQGNKFTDVATPAVAMQSLAANPSQMSLFPGVKQDTFSIYSSLANMSTAPTADTVAQALYKGLTAKGYSPNQVGAQGAALYSGLVRLRNSGYDFNFGNLAKDPAASAALNSYNAPYGALGQSVDYTKPEQFTGAILRNSQVMQAIQSPRFQH